MGLRCASCGYDNDPTRVYCHNCGTKLERGSTTPPPSGFTHPTDVLKMKRSRTAVPWGRYFGALGKLAALALLVAVVALVLLPPYDVPAPVEPDQGLADRYSLLLRDAANASSPRAFTLPAAEVNRWLVSVVRFAGEPSPRQLRPERVYAVPGNEKLRLGLEASLPGAGRVFFEGDFRPVRSAGGYTLQPVSYAIGRLPLPVFLGWPVQRQFAGLHEALAEPLACLARASYIGVDSESVTLRWAESGR